MHDLAQQIVNYEKQNRDRTKASAINQKKLFEARPRARIEELFLVASQGMLDSFIRHEPDDGNKYEKEAGYPNTHICGQGRRQVEQRR